jgi:multiple sugar transport system substrate-binding protein
MKKIISLLLVSILVLGLLAGCGTAPATPSADSTAAAAAPASTPAAQTTADEPKTPVKVDMWYYFEGKEQQQGINTIITGFNASQKDVEVTGEYVPFADFKKQLSIGLAASKLPDVAIIDNPDMAAYSAMGLFADITDKLKDWPDKDQYFPGPWKSTVYDGKSYGIPLGSNCLALYYNQDMLTKAGVAVPTTWDELKAAARKLTGNGVYGFGISAPKNEEGTFQFIPWLLSSGASADKVDGPEGIKAFSFLTDLIKDGSMSTEIINWTQGDVLKQFEAGKLAMMINGPWQIPDLKKNTPDLKYGVALTPKDKDYSSVLGGENWGVVAGKNVDASVKFLMYAVSPDVLKTYMGDFGYIPSRKDAAADAQFTGDPIMKVFVDELQYAMPRGPSPKWPQISDAISTALQESLTGAKTPEAAAKDAQVKIDKLK